MKAYFEFAGRTRTLLATFVATTVFLFLVFPGLPINGEMLDMKPGYSYDEAMASSAATTAKWTVGTVYQILGVGLFLIAMVRQGLARVRSGD
ncbi:MAG: hypothetical protein OXH37_03995 [Gammaproteobacteria bacterium]|nr:hypothetical protein [Gammaproteobacteria bacterium]